VIAKTIPARAKLARDYAHKSERFCAGARTLRRRAGLTLQELAERSGLAASTLSKIENGQLSPTFETLLRLADGLGIDVAELFNTESPIDAASARRSITRRGQGRLHVTQQYRYEMYCTDLFRKEFTPLVTTITARSIEAFQPLSRHQGEEFVYVLSGEIELHTEHYEPTRLRAGDGCYFDSSMGHACISVSKKDAEILWVASRANELSRAAQSTGRRLESKPDR
jgi:transcriptional regulator with XRE-family HTH domain